MKIFSISRIKNEEDIIESFVRYHLNFIDEMVIIEDYSNDETYNILKKLKDDEKLPIHIYRNSKKPIPQKEVINNAFNIALNDFNADLIVPLDTDEFLVCKDGGNPREILEKLPQDKYYHVFWRTYLPSLDEKSFSLERLESIRDPLMDDRSKIIIPSGLTEKYEVTITPGSHSIENKDIPSEELDELRIAHIPIRNKIQCISKEVIGWLNDISDYYKDPKASWHQNIMFRMLVESEGDISDDDIINYAKEYSSRKSFDVDIAEKKHPFDTSFCKNMELKYTPDYSENSYAKILEFSEDLALNYGKANQTLKDVNEDILDGNLDKMDYLCALDKNKGVIVCGDMNVAHEEIDLKNPKENIGNPGFSYEEREKFSELLGAGFTDTFRYLYPDLTGAYSWWSYRAAARERNTGWRIDYFLVSDRMKDSIKSAYILSEIQGSDHCPVGLDLYGDA